MTSDEIKINHSYMHQGFLNLMCQNLSLLDQMMGVLYIVDLLSGYIHLTIMETNRVNQSSCRTMGYTGVLVNHLPEVQHFSYMPFVSFIETLLPSGCRA